MFSRTINIDGTIIEVPCKPQTPYSEVLKRASETLEKEEENARDENVISLNFPRATWWS